MRSLYKWSLFLAAPGVLWSVFEMYGLTLGGPQMLFFTISHVFLPLILAVWLAVPFFVVGAFLNISALSIRALRQLLGLSVIELCTLAAVQLTIAASLIGYDKWSASHFRIIICIAGLITVVIGTRICIKWLYGAQPMLQVDGPASGGTAI